MKRVLELGHGDALLVDLFEELGHARVVACRELLDGVIHLVLRDADGEPLGLEVLEVLFDEMVGDLAHDGVGDLREGRVLRARDERSARSHLAQQDDVIADDGRDAIDIGGRLNVERNETER